MKFSKKDKRSAAGTGLFAGAACAACCAPPLIAALGVTLGLVAVAAVVAGIAAAVAVVILGSLVIGTRRRRAVECTPAVDEPVAAPMRRPVETG